MGTAENVAKLQDAYRQWHDSKGGSVKVWLDLLADDVKIRSLADGAPAVKFTSAGDGKEQFKRTSGRFVTARSWSSTSSTTPRH